MWVSPFRYLRIIGYLLLPEAFRSLSRLSSALSAKASTLRSFLLDLVMSTYGIVMSDTLMLFSPRLHSVVPGGLCHLSTTCYFALCFKITFVSYFSV